MKAEVKDEFLDLLINSSDDYKKGYQEFLRTQKPIDAAKDSLVGVLSDKSNVQLESALTKVFNSDIREIKALKAALDKQDPEAFAGMYRTYMQKLFESASSSVVEGVTDGPLVSNIPDQIFKKLLDTSNSKTFKTLVRYSSNKIG